MRRLATKKQRWMAYVLSKGKCSICGEILEKSFHVDHIKPYSKKGITELWNLQATCQVCNLKKGTKPGEGKGFHGKK